MTTWIKAASPLSEKVLALHEKTIAKDWPLLSCSPCFAAAVSGQAAALVAWREQLTTALTAEQQQSSHDFIRSWQQLGLAGSNYLRPPALPQQSYQLLLIDHSCTESMVRQMLQAAALYDEPMLCLAANTPNCQKQLQVVQQQLAGMDALKALQPRLHFQRACHTALLMQHCSRVFCHRSPLALEAILWQKPLWCLQDSPLASYQGCVGPFAAKPGFSAELLVHYAILAGSQALHPERNSPCSAQALLEWAGHQQRMRLQLPPEVFAYGFSRFWRKKLQHFVQGSRVTFIAKGQPLPKHGTLLVWGRRELPVVQPGLSLVRLEDGFIRSVGLGAEFAQPLSWILDQQGLYFDAGQPSDLEQLLQQQQLTPSQRQRAEALQQRICQQGITKYNVGQTGWQRPQGKQRVILVPGQVERDASIEFGAHQVRTNLELLQQVRQRNPDAWVIYKPHPDVYAGARAKGQGEDNAAQWCDELVLDSSMAEMLPQVDEVHLMTSLTGFEALLRGKKVVCYGWPFYAGWGLTEDRKPMPRRNRQLDLATLVYCTLIAYPRYLSSVTGGFSSPEQILDELELRRQRQPSLLERLTLHGRKGIRRVLNLLFGMK